MPSLNAESAAGVSTVHKSTAMALLTIQPGARLALAALLGGLLLLVAFPVWGQRDSRAEGYYQTGLSLKREGKLASAVDQFRQAIKLDPQYADAYWGLAWCLVGLGKDEAAIEAFRWVIRLAPETDNAVEAAKAVERIRLRRPGLDHTAPEPQTFLIALCMVREGNSDIYLADAEGVVRRRLTTELCADTQPAFSGDAHQIVFVSDRSGNQDLWAIKADGTGLRQLTTDPAPDYSPTWSPRGTEIVFVSERSGHPELWSLNLTTGEQRSLGQASGQDLAPAWSPSGDTLAFVSDREGTGKIYLWDPATRTARRLLSNTIAEYRPVWAPDGQFLYFSWSLEGNWQVCRVRPSGEGLEAVAPTPDNEQVWGASPDGNWLLVSSDRTGQSRLYLRSQQTGEVKAVGQANLEVLGGAVSPALPRAVAEILLTVQPNPQGTR